MGLLSSITAFSPQCLGIYWPRPCHLTSFCPLIRSPYSLDNFSIFTGILCTRLSLPPLLISTPCGPDGPYKPVQCFSIFSPRLPKKNFLLCFHLTAPSSACLRINAFIIGVQQRINLTWLQALSFPPGFSSLILNAAHHRRLVLRRTFSKRRGRLLADDWTMSKYPGW